MFVYITLFGLLFVWLCLIIDGKTHRLDELNERLDAMADDDSLDADTSEIYKLIA